MAKSSSEEIGLRIITRKDSEGDWRRWSHSYCWCGGGGGVES